MWKGRMHSDFSAGTCMSKEICHSSSIRITKTFGCETWRCTKYTPLERNALIMLPPFKIQADKMGQYMASNKKEW